MQQKNVKLIQKIALIIGVLVIPLMYSYFYLNAFWDPYQRLDEVPVAVVNLDEGAVINGVERNLGNEIADNLKEDGTLDFKFTSEMQAKRGVLGKEYYASITVPKDFSAKAATVGEDTKKLHGEIIYQANQKKNYLAAQILENAMPKIKDRVNSNIDKQIVETISAKVRDVPEQLGKLDEGLNRLSDGSKQIESGAGQLSAGAGTLSQGISTLNGKVPVLRKGAEKLSSGADQLADGAGQLAGNSGALNTGAAKLNRGAGDLLKGLLQYTGGVAQAGKGANTLRNGINQYTGGVSQANDGAAVLSNGINQYTNGVKSAGEGAENLKNGITEYTAGVSQAAAGAEKLKEGINTAGAGINQMSQKVNAAAQELGNKASDQDLDNIKGGAATLSAGLSDLNDSFSADGIMQLVEAYKATGDEKYKNQINQALVGTKSGISNLKTGAASLNTGVASLTQGMKDVKNNLGNLKSGIDQLQAGFGNEKNVDTLIGGAAALDTGLGELKKNNAALNGGAQSLNDGLGTLSKNNDSLNDGASQLKSGLSKLNSNNDALNTGTKQLDSGLSTLASNNKKLGSGASQLADGSKTLKKGISDYTDGAGKVSKGADQLAAGTKQLDSKLPVLATGVNKLDNGGKQLADGAGQLTDGTTALANGLETASNSVSESVSKANQQVGKLDGLSSYAAEPVKTKTEYVQPVANYGSAFAPYFMGLSLWVGGLLIFFGLYFDYNRRIKTLTRDSHRFILRTVFFGLVSIGQGVLLAFVIMSVLQIKVNNPFMLYWSSILVALTFTAIIQFCIINLGDIGKFLAMLLLILQLTSCAGTFPIETQNAFFRAISPFLPMTYSTQLFKEAISGMWGSNARNSALILVAFAAGFLLLTNLMSRKDIAKALKHISNGAKANA